jgi:hypothetical protein
VQDHSAAALWIALGFLGAVTLVLAAVRERLAIASKLASYTTPDGVKHEVRVGSIIPAENVTLVLPEEYRVIRVSLLRSLFVGKDNRLSTSKTVAFAWTYAVVFGLVALFVAKWLGSGDGYDKLIAKGLQPEYLLFLGGTYAAAILAKFKAVSDAQGEAGKPEAPIGTAEAKQLIADDNGQSDIGDFQYVLFNVVALGWFIGTFVPHLSGGMPDVPDLLAGLALTSAGGYSAKKLVSQMAPALTSIDPRSAPPSSETAVSEVEIWGRNLILPASASPDGNDNPPRVDIGGKTAEVTATSQSLSADRVTVKVPSTLTPGPVKVTVTRADGTPALNADGTDGLTLTITSANGDNQA